MDEQNYYDYAGYMIGAFAGVGSGMEMFAIGNNDDSYLGYRLAATLASGFGGALSGLCLARSSQGAFKGAIIGVFLLSSVGYPLYRYNQSNEDRRCPDPSSSNTLSKSTTN